MFLNILRCNNLMRACDSQSPPVYFVSLVWLSSIIGKCFEKNAGPTIS